MLKIKVPDGRGGFFLVHKDKVVTEWVAKNAFDFDSHASSDRTCRITSAVRKEMASMVSSGNLEHSPKLILTGHTAVVAFKNEEAWQGYDLYFGDLEHAVRLGRRKIIFSYLLQGHTKNVQTHWLWYRLKSTSTITNSSPIELDDATAQYVRCSAPDWQNAITLTTDDNMLPIITGTFLIPCDSAKCCGKCFSAPLELLNELKRFLTEVADQ